MCFRDTRIATGFRLVNRLIKRDIKIVTVVIHMFSL